ncbi:hypothetical protein MUK42_07147 [Musa troglodytarum]|uniref:Protein LAZ1 n=1 Tax=Musa troglodytarum TaxID=320322 RepID=A0A9E7H7H7_9LILI|nr:hypothetical protein MUK42_07147 [Musa troglodytarum]
MRVMTGFLSLVHSNFSPLAWATVVAGFFVLVALSFSAFLVFEHLSAYKNPEEQKFLIGVILMVPCYSIESYASLVNPSLSVDCGILRDCYEAFAMYCFGRYFVACLGMPLSRQMIIKTITAILSVIFEAFGVYCEGEFKLGCGYPYMAAVLNFSQYWALYCLVQFYTAIKDELAHTKPLAKFLMFKSIVFLTWWQGVTIALLYTFGLLKSPIAQGLQFKSSIQDFFICIELQDSSKLKVLTDSLVLPAQMAVASVAHLYVFPAKPYELLADQSPGNVSVLGDYASVDCPVDPDEVRDSTRPTKLRLPQPDVSVKSVTDIRESVRDIVVGGGEHIVNDFKFTAVEPVEKSFTRLNEASPDLRKHKKHDKDRRKARGDSCITSPDARAVRGIDDPLLNGTTSDGGVSRGRQRSRKSGCTSESGGESSNQGRGEYETHGCRWVIRD